MITSVTTDGRLSGEAERPPSDAANVTRGPDHNSTTLGVGTVAMPRVEQPPTRVIPPVCPRPDCELPIISDVTRTVRGVVLSDRMCQGAHPTMLKWVA